MFLGCSSSASGGHAPTQDVLGDNVGTMTEPDSVIPCEPGTKITLQGQLEHETGSGKVHLIHSTFIINGRVIVN